MRQCTTTGCRREGYLGNSRCREHAECITMRCHGTAGRLARCQECYEGEHRQRMADLSLPVQPRELDEEERTMKRWDLGYDGLPRTSDRR